MAKEIVLTNTQKEIVGLAQQIVEIQKNYLISKGKIASGDLVNSIEYQILNSQQGEKVEFLADEQWVYVEDGRRAGAKFPPPQPIAKWLNEKRIRPRRGVSMESLVYLISRGIAKKGIRPTPFVEYSQQFMEQEIDRNKSLLEAFETDVLNTIPSTI